jgi:hypothetical protein
VASATWDEGRDEAKGDARRRATGGEGATRGKGTRQQRRRVTKARRNRGNAERRAMRGEGSARGEGAGRRGVNEREKAVSK